MAGKHQPERIRVIDRVLRTRRKYTVEELINHVLKDPFFESKENYSISERSIEGDISDMRKGWSGHQPAPIANEDQRYFYSEDFNLFGMPIKDQETFTLMNALDILNQFPEFEHNEQVSEIIDKLKKALNINNVEVQRTVIDFEKVEYPAGTKWISKLYGYTKERQPLHLDYQPFNKEGFQAQVVPLLLKEYNGRWFLIAYNLGMKKFQNYALDRIQKIEEYYFDLRDTIIDFDADSYFKNTIGVSREDDGPKKIRFRTSDYLAAYFRTKRMHHSQMPVKGLKNVFELYVDVNIELIAKLMSYGEDLVVLEPEWLVQRIKRKVQELNKLYKK
ncbi:MAG: WYL domain-containing protein [Cyclobacteriaceae bacterium]